MDEFIENLKKAFHEWLAVDAEDDAVRQLQAQRNLQTLIIMLEGFVIVILCLIIRSLV